MDRIKALFAPFSAWLSAKVHAWFPRMGWSAAATLGLGFVVFLIAPQQIGVLVYKLVCITAGAVTMYYVFRELFPYNRPSLLLEEPDASGFRAIKAGCQVRYWIAVALQGLAAIAGALAVALAL
jgi:hypothetical protein